MGKGTWVSGKKPSFQLELSLDDQLNYDATELLRKMVFEGMTPENITGWFRDSGYHYHCLHNHVHSQLRAPCTPKFDFVIAHYPVHRIF